MKSPWITIIVVLFGLTLSGCFRSDIPFVSPEEADFPFQRLTYEIVGEDDRVTLVRVGDGYVAPNEQGDSSLRLKLLGNGIYLLQAKIEDSDGPYYLYALAKLETDGKSAEIIKPFAEGHERELARQGHHGFRICPEDEQMICLTDLQAFIDYAVSSTTNEKKQIRILSED